MPSQPPDTIAEALRRAVAARDDGAAAAILCQLGAAAADGTPPPLLRTTFEELAAAGLAAAALAMARLEVAGEELGEADTTADGGTFLHVAAAAGAGAPVLQALIQAGCAIDAHDGSGCTALHAAAAAGRLATCAALLAEGADPLARDGNGRTARLQGGSVPADVKALLAEAEEATRQRRGAVLWAKLAAMQTQSAFRVGCL